MRALTQHRLRKIAVGAEYLVVRRKPGADDEPSELRVGGTPLLSAIVANVVDAQENPLRLSATSAPLSVSLKHPVALPSPEPLSLGSLKQRRSLPVSTLRASSSTRHRLPAAPTPPSLAVLALISVAPSRLLCPVLHAVDAASHSRFRAPSASANTGRPSTVIRLPLLLCPSHAWESIRPAVESPERLIATGSHADGVPGGGVVPSPVAGRCATLLACLSLAQRGVRM